MSKIDRRTLISFLLAFVSFNARRSFALDCEERRRCAFLSRSKEFVVQKETAAIGNHVTVVSEGDEAARWILHSTGSEGATLRSSSTTSPSYKRAPDLTDSKPVRTGLASCMRESQ